MFVAKVQTQDDQCLFKSWIAEFKTGKNVKGATVEDLQVQEKDNVLPVISNIKFRVR